MDASVIRVIVTTATSYCFVLQQALVPDYVDKLNTMFSNSLRSWFTKYANRREVDPNIYKRLWNCNIFGSNEFALEFNRLQIDDLV